MNKAQTILRKDINTDITEQNMTQEVNIFYLFKWNQYYLDLHWMGWCFNSSLLITESIGVFQSRVPQENHFCRQTSCRHIAITLVSACSASDHGKEKETTRETTTMVQIRHYSWNPCPENIIWKNKLKWWWFVLVCLLCVIQCTIWTLVNVIYKML